ncbi:vWA domain-containing protein [Bacillus sp. SD088]|uniref:vWA domain-containing protein n=1 Tax=Bacillus sp. SD088 TaxID=2782012 RepID=UPI001A96D93F|nr:BatA and WFA domain-containing protein [Bacillus sp. SD088]MBO0994693.1 BatA and WFA domain-containing protein [Bacillus sp. SD088]
MRFLTPGFLGLSVFLLGVILFYLFRKQYEKQIVSSTFFWQQVMREWQATKWWRKIQQHLLLYLQLLILTLLMFALVRPYIGVSDLSGEQIVVVIDTSASMTALEGENNRLELAKEEMNELIDQLDTQRLTAILAKQTPEILFSNETNKSEMRRAIENISPSFQSEDIDKSVQLANQLLSDSSGEIHVFSDRTRQEEITTTHLSHKTEVHNIGTTTNNLSIHAFGAAKQEDTVNGVLSIANEMDEQQQVTIQIVFEDEKLAEIEETVDPEKPTQIHIQDLPEKPYYKAMIVNKDHFQADNASFAFLGEDRQPTFYLVGKMNSFLTKALSHLSTDIIQIEELNEVPQTENAIYVLSNVPAENWPNGPKLIISPTVGEPFNIKNEQMLQTRLKAVSDDSLLQFVDIEEVYIQKSYPFTMPELQAIVSSGETSIISKGNYQGSPIILLGFDMEDTDWPMHSSFPIFLYNAIDYLTDQNQLLGYLQSNERKEIAYSTGVTSSTILNEENETIADMNIDNSILIAPERPGLYKVAEETEFGLKERLFAVIVDEEEKYISPEDSFTIETENEETGGDNQKHPNEIWTVFATLALFILFLEWEVYRRGITG